MHTHPPPVADCQAPVRHSSMHPRHPGHPVPRSWTGLSGSNSPVVVQEAALRLADSVGDTARSIGAVNTLIRQADGSLAAHNTDWTAAIGAIEAGLTGRLPDQAGALGSLLGFIEDSR